MTTIRHDVQALADVLVQVDLISHGSDDIAKAKLVIIGLNALGFTLLRPCLPEPDQESTANVVQIRDWQK